ncbi:hypothetical protein HMPREF0731_1923, partial [Pseudoroseomonas cervicalis ATCC 49957]
IGASSSTGFCRPPEASSARPRAPTVSAAATSSGPCGPVSSTGVPRRRSLAARCTARSASEAASGTRGPISASCRRSGAACPMLLIRCGSLASCGCRCRPASRPTPPTGRGGMQAPPWRDMWHAGATCHPPSPGCGENDSCASAAAPGLAGWRGSVHDRGLVAFRPPG